jgi:hypothetical protein
METSLKVVSSGTSCYQRHRKSPFRYSDLYQQWKSAVLRGDDKTARQVGYRHTQRFLRGVLDERDLRAA